MASSITPPALISTIICGGSGSRLWGNPPIFNISQNQGASRLQQLSRWNPANRRVWTNIIIGPLPLCGQQLCMFNVVEQIQFKQLVSCRSIKSLYIGILCWFSRLNIEQCNLLFYCPVNQIMTYELRTVITSQSQRFAPPFNDLLQRPHNPLGGK